MAAPATLNIGTRVTVTMAYLAGGSPLNPVLGAGPQSVPFIGGATPPVQFGLACEIPGMITNQGQALPGLCQTVSGSAPDFAGSSAIIFDLAGAAWHVTLGVFQTTWVSGGSLTGQRHWNYVDLTF
jgi:hypothetical protein